MSGREQMYVTGSPKDRSERHQAIIDGLELKAQWEDEVVRCIERSITATIVQSQSIEEGTLALIGELSVIYPGVAGYKVYRKDALEEAARKIMGNNGVRFFMVTLASYLDQQAAYYTEAKNMVNAGYANFSNQKDVFGLGSSQIDDISPSTSFTSMYSDSSLARAIYWFSQMIEFSNHGPKVCRLARMAPPKKTASKENTQ